MTRTFTNGQQHKAPVSLPSAKRERWQPIRGGLLNLYLFDYEEFRYEDGHLILRGNNGTGKSRVMAMQLPFLLDGHLGSSRVEPDADAAKKMDWNLLMGRYNDRLGYTWIEFGRLLPTSRNGEAHGSEPPPSGDINGKNGHGFAHECEQQFITLGCGLSATKGSGMRDPWFFITHQRIGDDLFLQTDAGVPLGKSGLADAIGDKGSIYTTAREYRQAVDDALFGLGKQRYDAMVDLLIQLRKPQLSKNLDEKTLASVLGEALPPPSAQMIADVAESFRGLETDRGELNRFRLACDGVDNFLKTYQRYAQIASRRRAADVRHSHSKYESVLRDLRQAEREHVEARDSLTATIVKLRSLEIKSGELSSRIDTLRVDPKMRSAETIKQAADDEKQAQIDLEQATKELTNATVRLDQRRKAHDELFRQTELQLKKSSQVWEAATRQATACELKVQHESAFSGLSLRADSIAESSVGNPASSKDRIERVISARHQSSDQLKKRNQALAQLTIELSHAKQRRDDAQQRVEEAIQNQRLAEDQRRQAVDDFLEAYQMWRRDSDELTMPSDEEISGDIDEWSQRVESPSPIASMLRRAELDARQRVDVLRARLQHRIDEIAVVRADAKALVEKLQQGFHEPPALPSRVNEVARSVRPGAPFWSLVDFVPSCPMAFRANIEAALEAAGVLNAWVTPDGSVLSPDFADVSLCITGSPDVAEDKCLLQTFRPDDRRSGTSCTVSDSIIRALLRKVGYGALSAEAWIDSNGQWQNGPLHGQCQKEAAQYVGQDARENHRAWNLGMAQAELHRLDDETGQVEQQRRSVEGKLASITTQVQAFPSESPIREAASAVAGASRRTIDCRNALTGAEHAVTESQKKADTAQEGRDLDARDLGLFDWRDRLEELDRIMTNYRELLAALWPSLEHFESVRSQCASALASRQEADRDVTHFDEKRHDQETRHAKADQRLKTLQETIGVEAEQILRELTDAANLLRDVQAEVKQVQAKEKEDGNQVVRTEERVTARGEAVRAETENRQLACDAFQRLCLQGLLKSAGQSYDDDPTGWSVTRTVEVSRQTETTLSSTSHDDSAWDRVQDAVSMNIQDLNTVLSQHAFTPTLSTVDGLYKVTVPYQGQVRSIHELREIFAEEVRQRQLVLDEREREIIENHLIGEVATKLHEQIYEAYLHVEKMNAEIQKRPMSTGMMLRFDWKPDEEQSPGIVEMCKKLLAATGTWSPAERTAIGRYLQQHIKSVRDSREAGTWQEHLAEALDYRLWHRFWVMKKQDSVWKRLTKRTHGTSSTGEKAVALTIPQFAAAAAHYSSARSEAPRLILLDEAFVGIDPDMRGKCMELIRNFDLDFLLTSESEWGCYPGLPGVAIHQLSRRPGLDAIFLTRWIWNGKQRVKDETPIPPAARLEDS